MSRRNVASNQTGRRQIARHYFTTRSRISFPARTIADRQFHEAQIGLYRARAHSLDKLFHSSSVHHRKINSLKRIRAPTKKKKQQKKYRRYRSLQTFSHLETNIIIRDITFVHASLKRKPRATNKSTLLVYDRFTRERGGAVKYTS